MVQGIPREESASQHEEQARNLLHLILAVLVGLIVSHCTKEVRQWVSQNQLFDLVPFGRPCEYHANAKRED